jgi:peptidoglycan pentaglycine glycine transferase (the first glycine)
MEVKLINDKQVWDNFVTHSYETSFFQSYNWGEFQRSLGFEVLRLGFFEADQLVAVAQGIIIRAKRGKYLYVRNGPVADWTNIEQIKFIIDTLKQQAKQHRLWHVRISPLISKNSVGAEFIRQQHFPVSPMYDVDALDTWVLDLDQTLADILSKMRKTTRYEINRATKLGVTVESYSDPSKLKDFYTIYRDTIDRQHWTGYSEKYLLHQFQTFVEDQQAKLFLAKYQEQYIAGAIFIYYGDTCYYHYAGSLTAFKKIPAPYLLQWENIKYAKEMGLKKYNFWGIAPEDKLNHPWQGLSFFKMGFGGDAKRWLETRDIPVSPFYNLTYLFEKIDKGRKGY